MSYFKQSQLAWYAREKEGKGGLWRTRTRAKHGARLERMTAGQNLKTLSCKNAIDANFSFSVSL